jgi:NADH dehydrogenase
MHLMLRIIRRRRLVVNIPFGVARVLAALFGFGRAVTFGLLPAPITTDQVRNLARDNVVGAGARGFAEIGIVPTAMEAVLPDYLWRFRPSGQFAAIKESAQNLRKP